MSSLSICFFFFFNDTATTEIYTLSLHDALPIYWYAFTQVETQLTVDSLYNVWHPQIVHDIHQMDANGARLFLPPYLDPVEPNVDPLLIDGVNALGSAMAWELAGQGKTGISINSTYDAW